ncbi:MAG TPA: phosphotransferase [Anaerolineales bacterium]|nr:phosphotransferase [Anaerolineales bacterium]
MTVTIQQVVELIPSWAGRHVEIAPMGGGLTNANYRVEVDGRPHFVRIPGASTELLAVDRRNEIYNARAAAETGVAPPLLHVLPDDDVMIFEFINGQTMSAARLQAAGMPARLAQSIQRLHAGPRFLQDFDMFRLVEVYLKTAADHGVAIPADYRGYLPRVAEIEQALLRRALPTVPCHNDLLAENYIDDGRQLWLIDFEYSGNNDPCFELGNTCQELQYNDDQYRELCAAYFGEATPSRLARMRLFALMSDVGWTLWGAIQARISTLDYDFWAYAMTRWNRALGILNGPHLDEWLRDA